MDHESICSWNVEDAEGTLSKCTSDSMAYEILLLREIFIVNSVVSHASAGRPQSGLAAALSKQLLIKCNFIHKNNNLLELQIKEISLIIIVACIPQTPIQRQIIKHLPKLFNAAKAKHV